MKNSRDLKVCYFGVCDMNYSRNKVFSDALRKKGICVIECTSKETGLTRYKSLYEKHKAIRNDYDVMIVGFPGFIISPFAKIISKKKVILDALSSRYDSDIVSRNVHKGNWFKKIKIMIVDWLAFKFADIILVETEAQKDFVSKKFRVSKSKIEVVYTGVDETYFKKDPNIKKHAEFTVIFRGRIMNEAGVPTILKAAALLRDEHINFDIIGYGWGPWIEESRELYKGLDQTKVHWSETELTFNELVERTAKAHISLGQFGNNERLERTIPHKAFEAMILGVPYITARSGGIAEALTDNESCLMISANDPGALAEAILKLKNDLVLAECVAKRAEEIYYDRFDAKAIGERLADIVYSSL